MTPTEIIERIMTQHWDMVACDCWVCVEAGKGRCRPRDTYLGAERRKYPFVSVEVSWMEGISRPVKSTRDSAHEV